MHLGLFGGTFDPPHIGHLIVAETIRAQFALSRVVWMPAAIPPHKAHRDLTPAAIRLALVRTAIADNPFFEASDLELRREGPSYTVDTLRHLHAHYPDARLSLLIGGDSLAGFAQWREPGEIARLAGLLVYGRQGAAPDAALPPGADVRFAEGGHVDVSSSHIRARLHTGETVRYLVPDAVLHEIARRGLYRAKP